MKKDDRYISPSLRWIVWERDDFTCQHCGRRSFLSVDHVVPYSKGGATTADNLQTLCRGCNSKKGNRPYRPHVVKPAPIVVKAPRQRFVRQSAPKPEYIPVAKSWPYIGPDQRAPKFQCAYCGLINSEDGDGCSCHQRLEETTIYYCIDCEYEEAEDGQLCTACAIYCEACEAELPYAAIDYQKRQTCISCDLAESVA